MSSEETLTCKQVWDEMNALLSVKNTKLIRNYNRTINMTNFSVETDLFPLAALQVYSAYNLEEPIQEQDRIQYFSAHRGGSQGDYRKQMTVKIDNVVDCLRLFPSSKRAVITIPNTSTPSHTCDDDAKCMREIHFYLDDTLDGEESCVGTDGCVLNATVWMRAQAAEIFPKNIHFIGSLMKVVAAKLSTESQNVQVGTLFYLATTLVSVRED
jgi:hypothetical protein